MDRTPSTSRPGESICQTHSGMPLTLSSAPSRLCMRLTSRSGSRQTRSRFNRVTPFCFTLCKPHSSFQCPSQKSELTRSSKTDVLYPHAFCNRMRRKVRNRRWSGVTGPKVVHPSAFCGLGNTMICCWCNDGCGKCKMTVFSTESRISEHLPPFINVTSRR